MLKKIITIILTGGIIMALFSGCAGAKYHVDYCGRKDSFKGAKDSYRAGAHVTLVYDLIATDTDYRFYVDGADFNTDYKESKGYIISFTMPAHDVTVRVESRNTMMYIPPDTPEAVLTFDSFDGGGPEYTVTVDDPSVVTFDQTKKYYDNNHAELDGAPYQVNITFFGLKAGATTVTVTSRSPIEDSYDVIYDITVSDDLAVTITEKN